MAERILVTGGAGFIASQVARAYLAAGHEVLVVDDLSTGHSRNVPGHASFAKVDIRDYEALVACCKRFMPTVVNHHAAQSTVLGSWQNPRFTHEVNVMGTLYVLELAACYGVERVIFASSGAVYGDGGGGGVASWEDDEVRPLSAYGFTKLAGESYLRFYAETKGLSPVIFRYGNVYGPGQPTDGAAGVIAIFAGRLLAGGHPTIRGHGDQTRDYIHVSDVVRANLLALDGPAGTYNIATGTSTALLDVLKMVQDATGEHKPPGYSPMTPGDAQSVRLDVSKASGQLGFTAAVGLADGIADVVAHLRNNGD